MNRWSSAAFAVAAMTAGCAPTLPVSANWYLAAEGDAVEDKKRLYLAVVNRGESTLSISGLRVNVDAAASKSGCRLMPIKSEHPLSLEPGEVYVALLTTYNDKDQQAAATCPNPDDKGPPLPWPNCTLPSNLEVTLDDKKPPYKHWSLGYRSVIPVALPAVLPNALPRDWETKCAWPRPQVTRFAG